MSQKGVKEAFVANLNGTTLLEISLGLPLAPSCLLARGLLLILYFLHRGEPLRSRSGHFLLDFAVLVVPPILSCTVLAPFLPLVILSLWAFCAGLLLAIYRRRAGGVLQGPLKHALRHFGETSLAPEYIPSITVFRVYVNVLTSIAILAVDFPQYPRRYAKTESFGTGVMDFGVGSFVFGNAVVCPEVRQKPGAVQRASFYLAKQVLAVWPLLLLGFGRLMSLKVVGYQEHVSEYGLHWNFFFTLAAVRMAASLLLGVFSARRAWIVAVVLAVAYECLLAVTPLKSFILSGSDGQGSRAGFLSANREGLFSVIGYLAIYMASVQVGLYLRQKRTTVGEWMAVVRTFLLAAFLLLVGLHVTQTHVERVSRRMANLAFCLWVEAHCLLLFSAFLAADLALVFAKLLAEGAPVPGSWELAEPPATRKKRDGEPQARKAVPQGVCMIGAVNRNQLLYFLLANVLTGLANMLVDTLHSSTPSALLVLHLYMFANCLAMYVLQAKDIVLKWW